MSYAKKLVVAVVPLIVAVAAGYFIAYAATDHAQTLTFMMAHKPDNAENVALIQEFADTVYQRTDGAVRIEPVVPSYGPEANGDPADIPMRALKDVADGSVFMAQISVKRFSELYPELYPLNALDAPGVFRSHEHASHVLDGDVGTALQNVVSDETDGALRGLGFTYSGGYRNILSTVPVTSLAGLSGHTMRGTSVMARDTMEALGVALNGDISLGSDAWVSGMTDGSLQLEEAENLRLESYRHSVPEVVANIDTVVETNHSMYLTQLTANGPAFDALTPEQQSIIAEEAHTLALAERELSIRQADEIKAYFEGEGVTFYTLTAAEQKKMDSIAAQVRAKYDDLLGDWFDRIAATE